MPTDQSTIQSHTSLVGIVDRKSVHIAQSSIQVHRKIAFQKDGAPGKHNKKLGNFNFHRGA